MYDAYISLLWLFDSCVTHALTIGLRFDLWPLTQVSVLSRLYFYKLWRTIFGADSSTRFPFRACTNKQMDRQTQTRKQADGNFNHTTSLVKIKVKVKVAHTQVPSEGFRSWSRFLAVSMQVTWVINPAVGCHYFPLGLQLPPQPLKRLLPILLLSEQRHNGCDQFA